MQQRPPHGSEADSHDPFEDGLAAAFGPEAGASPARSVLGTLERRAKSSLSVHLDGRESDGIPVQVTEAARALRDPSGRYQILGEIGRGGVGVVFKGRDGDLGRDVAMKVLRDEYADHPEVLARFVEEAQIGGQLQHPGIVPVYEMGLQNGERPYFAMKLVKGETLSAQLGCRRDVGDDRRRFLGVFEQVCQTLAYAHARNVVHRDLKPANIMIGAFGEVQVVDWGFAKVLARGGVADEAASRREDSLASVISTVRSEPGSGSHSVAGSMLGTPAYMPPEQALGDLERIDTRSDVFGLGAILCEILTGAPPYREEDGDLIRQAAGGELDGAFERLRRSGAEEGMVALCMECLARTQQARPASAQEVAERVSAHLTSVEERARKAEIAATEARYRQRMTVLSAVSAVLLLGLGAGSWWWVDAQARARARAAAERVAAAAGGVREARARAQAAGLDGELWHSALVEAERLEDLAESEPIDVELRATTAALLTGVREEHAAATEAIDLLDRDRDMRQRLITVRIPLDEDLRSDDFGRREPLRLDAAYRAAFAFYLGRPVEEVTTEEALASMRAGELDVELAAALDHWAFARHYFAKAPEDLALTAKLYEVATLLDPGDAWRSELRALLRRTEQAPEALRELAALADLSSLTVAHCEVLARILSSVGANEEAVDLLRRARQAAPQDFGLAYALATGLQLLEEPDWQAAFAALEIARALRPDLGEVLHRQAILCQELERHGEAELISRELLAREPDNTHWIFHLAIAQHRAGKGDEAIPTYRRVLEREPDHPKVHYYLADLLAKRGEVEAAIAHYRRAIELNPENEESVGVRPFFGLSDALKLEGRDVEALEVLRLGHERIPENPLVANDLGLALYFTAGRVEEALATVQKAIELDPNDVRFPTTLCYIQGLAGLPREAVESGRRALELDPDHGLAHIFLGSALQALGRTDEGFEHLVKGVELAPDVVEGRVLLGEARRLRGEWDEATENFRRGVELDPTHLKAGLMLGIMHRLQGDLDGSVKELRRVLEHHPAMGVVHFNLGEALFAQGLLPESLEAFEDARAALEGQPGGFEQMLAGVAAERVEEVEGAPRLLAIARGERDPDDPRDWGKAADLAYRAGRIPGAARAFARAFEQVPELARDADLLYAAACAAALAAGDAERKAGEDGSRNANEFRARSLGWLAAALELRRRAAELDPGSRPEIVEKLLWWRADKDLASLRDEAALAALPAPEAERCRQLWRDVDRVLEECAGVE